MSKVSYEVAGSSVAATLRMARVNVICERNQ